MKLARLLSQSFLLVLVAIPACNFNPPIPRRRRRPHRRLLRVSRWSVVQDQLATPPSRIVERVRRRAFTSISTVKRKGLSKKFRLLLCLLEQRENSTDGVARQGAKPTVHPIRLELEAESSGGSKPRRTPDAQRLSFGVRSLRRRQKESKLDFRQG